MAVSYSITHRDIVGTKRRHIVNVTLDSSYPTGGEAVTANGFGLGAITGLIPQSNDGNVPVWDATNSKILMYWVDTTVDGAALAEVASTTNLATTVVTCTVTGH